MKLIKVTLVALNVAIFMSLCLIMIWFDAISWMTSLITLFLILSFGGISYAIAGIDKVEKQMKNLQ